MSVPLSTASSHSTAVHLQTTDKLDTLPPPWLAEALLLAQLWQATGLGDRLYQQVRLERGHMGRYLVLDFVLVLLAYALSGEPSVQTFYQHLQPVAPMLMAVWGRQHLPHRSTLSRFLQAVGPKTVGQLRSLFLADLNQQGFQAAHCGGLFDRMGERWLLFDIDGTRACVRQRAIPTAKEYPTGRRRRPACAAGYTGRKRGERVRTRTAVLQAHTGEWLGGLAAAGNGSTVADIEQAGHDIGGYLAARGFALPRGIVRLDGLYGSLKPMRALVATGLGVVVRARDYGLLKLPWVKRCLEAGPTGYWQDPDTGVERQVFDVGVLVDWPYAKAEPTSKAIALRLVVTARVATEGHDIAIGKLKDGRIWELFLTSLPQQGFTGVDVLNLYLARGLLENGLRHEDQEQQIDRWVSISADGQSFYQLIALWVANQRLWLGQRAEPDNGRRTTLWSPAAASSRAYSQVAPPPAPTQPPSVPTTPPPMAKAASPPPKPAATCRVPAARTRRPFTDKDFRVSAQRTVHCPAGTQLSRRNRVALGGGHERWIFAASYDACLRCPLALECIGEALPKVSCRQVAYRLCPESGRLLPEADPRLPPLPAPPPAPELPPPPPTLWCGGPEALWWKDVASCRLRRQWSERLRAQRVIIAVQELERPPVADWVDRHQRAHRRLNWSACHKRNALQNVEVRWTVQLHGVPAAISKFLQLPKPPDEQVSAPSA